MRATPIPCAVIGTQGAEENSGSVGEFMVEPRCGTSRCAFARRIRRAKGDEIRRDTGLLKEKANHGTNIDA